MNHEEYMKLALQLAEEAATVGEVPVGCVITGSDGVILGTGRNMREEKNSALSHAEIEAISMACKAKGSWRLSDCTLYVTLEPCPMCAGAMINARIGKVFYGAKEPVFGSCGSVINLFMERYGHEPQIVGGVLEKECAGIMKRFFEKVRDKSE